MMSVTIFLELLSASSFFLELGEFCMVRFDLGIVPGNWPCMLCYEMDVRFLKEFDFSFGTNTVEWYICAICLEVSNVCIEFLKPTAITGSLMTTFFCWICYATPSKLLTVLLRCSTVYLCSWARWRLSKFLESYRFRFLRMPFDEDACSRVRYEVIWDLIKLLLFVFKGFVIEVGESPAWWFGSYSEPLEMHSTAAGRLITSSSDSSEISVGIPSMWM